MKRIECNETFFEKPNLINCAYAGFIATDGCISERPHRQKTLSISIHSKDSEYLESFSQDLNFQGRLSFNNTRHMVRINICSNKICEDLFNNFNIVPRKTFILEPPKIDNEDLIKAYMIGAIDGDGCIRSKLDKNRKVPTEYLSLNIVSASEKYLKWFKFWFDKWDNYSYRGQNLANLGFDKRHNGSFKYEISGKRAINVCRILDSINVTKLERKWNTARKFY